MGEKTDDFWAGIDLEADRCWAEAPDQAWHYFCDREAAHDGPHEHRFTGTRWCEGCERWQPQRGILAVVLGCPDCEREW